MILAKECARQARKCDQNALKNKQEKKELEALEQLPIRKKILQSNRADTLYRISKELYESVQSDNLPLDDDQVMKIASILDHDRHEWLHPDQNKSKKHLRLRTELACLLAKHYSSCDENTDNAVKYYQIALEKFSIGKYDIHGKAYRSYADFLKNTVFDKDLLSLEDITSLQQAVQNYKTAAKATYHHSAETELDSSFSDAAMIYQRFANEDSLAVMHEYYGKKAVKCAKNALKIVGEIDIEIINRFERGLLSPSQKNALMVLKKHLGLDSEERANQSLTSSSTAPTEFIARTSSSSANSSETREKRSRESELIDSDYTDSETGYSDFEADTSSTDTDHEIYGPSSRTLM